MPNGCEGDYFTRNLTGDFTPHPSFSYLCPLPWPLRLGSKMAYSRRTPQCYQLNAWHLELIWEWLYMAVLAGKEKSWSIYITVDIKHYTTEHHSSSIFLNLDRHSPSRLPACCSLPTRSKCLVSSLHTRLNSS